MHVCEWNSSLVIVTLTAKLKSDLELLCISEKEMCLLFWVTYLKPEEKNWSRAYLLRQYKLGMYFLLFCFIDRDPIGYAVSYEVICYHHRRDVYLGKYHRHPNGFNACSCLPLFWGKCNCHMQNCVFFCVVSKIFFWKV